MTDLQVITLCGGFGKAGAWLSDRRDRMFELTAAKGNDWEKQCDPKHPTDPAVSSSTWPGI